jgi:hypothetical protein
MGQSIKVVDGRIVEVTETEKVTDDGFLDCQPGVKYKVGDMLSWYTAEGRIPDDKLVQMGLRFDKRGVYRDPADHHASTVYIIDFDEEPPAGYEQGIPPPLQDEEYQYYDRQSMAWHVDKPKKEYYQALTDMEAARAVIASTDYKVIKAYRLGKPVEELYPGITEEYQANVAVVQRCEKIVTEYEEAHP